jgi:two-component system nitrate/nitrite sensor histidine kinase NarX
VPRSLRAARLSTKLGLIGSILLLLALASIGLTLSVTWQLEGGAAAVNEAGRMRMQTWRLAQAVSAGDTDRIDTYLRRFDETIELLGSGDPQRPLFVPRDAATQRAFGEVRRNWDALRPVWTTAPPAAPDEVAVRAQAFVDRIDSFVSAIESRLATWTAILNVFQLAMMGLAISAAVALLYAAYLFVFNPLARLQRGLESVESGDLAARVEVASDDEFGALSAGFNRMTETLEGLYRNLEAKVREKTETLEAERSRLAALYEASAVVARAGTLDELARGFAGHLRAVARADAAAVRWSDEANRHYLLLAHDGLPAELVKAEACLNTGDCACGQPREKAATRVIPVHDANRLGHCARAGFAGVVAVPVRLHERVLGEIELFYRTAPAREVEDRALLESLAAHLAAAMEGLRAAALDREAAVAEERGLLARELHDSIAQSLAFLKIQVQLLRDAVRRGEPAQIERGLGELEAGVRESTADVRELLVHFRTRTNSEAIEPALRSTLQKFEHQTGLPTHLHIEGQGLPLPADVQVQVLHVVQEALSNVRKHAAAREVWVDVQEGPDWQVAVRDDGRGFSAADAVPDETHVGLRIMRERARTIGAQVQVRSKPGTGTEVVLSLPRAEAIAA